MAYYTVIIICTEPSDAKSWFHWESASLEPHLPVNKQNLQVFFCRLTLQCTFKKSRKYYMILIFCSVSHLNLTVVKENIISWCQIMRTSCIYCRSILNVATHLQRAYVQKPISEDILYCVSRANPEELG